MQMEAFMLAKQEASGVTASPCGRTQATPSAPRNHDRVQQGHVRAIKGIVALFAAVCCTALPSSTSAQDDPPALCADPCPVDGPSCTTARGTPHNLSWKEIERYTAATPSEPEIIKRRVCTKVYTPISVVCMEGDRIISHWVGHHELTTCTPWS